VWPSKKPIIVIDAVRIVLTAGRFLLFFPPRGDDIEYASLKIYGLDPEEFVDRTDDNIDLYSY
jgi:Ni,Fe-hydrogenase maturation factor